ncbi:TIGR00730 family Rossman fold protein [Dyadobacter flavalbus]|uniref:Cytokinin riboside 5'-monophosphate phosphoribohydrolase n=1 Tax=Dyadobacter flavalbus TaxID=2579942 RepID=A0A5M8QST1_9BACT|nr:TIGR00730 family Rossman fold protein [Dyadobacter flavalbus]KAA6439305.1 TIGR00730 family Rossman fold protein [Dyadobacter flavalbus]
MKSIAVFCGSNFGQNPDYLKIAKVLASELVHRDITLVYGGGAVGLMGAIADEVLHFGGDVIGVLPEKLAGVEIGHKGLTELHIVKTMHERKALMAELSDGFIAMPGGIGTLEEIIEVFTWNQLGFHQKPCGLLNINGFYDKLISFLSDLSENGFLSYYHFKTLLVNENPASLVDELAAQKLTYQPKWIK